MYKKLVTSNRKAKGQLTHYVVYWKNESAYQKEYKEMFQAGTEIDARAFAKRMIVSDLDQCKITKINNYTETEIAIITENL